MTSCARQSLRTSRPRPADPSERTLYSTFEKQQLRKAFVASPYISKARPTTSLLAEESHRTSRRTLSTSPFNMSWMDSWSRPSKSQATPPPLYLTIGDSVPYCHTCGRVIGDRKKTSGATEVKYCSQRCRHQKPGPIDRKIEAIFAKLLEGATPESIKEEQEQAKQAQDAGSKEGERKSLEKEKEKNLAADEDDNPKFNKKNKSAHKKKPSKSKNTPKGDHRVSTAVAKTAAHAS
ncbi:hypothetical protein OPT61_g10290 [Boeremia exigua]|uniref:Uncharacterized protein n=1 Tax=Boeremia exigua TaxID=749465 RepID=A0ACC2HQD0_9PLEO|nr:hypothetical protein OPT61_g10290 [Boeremia exigua]